MVTQLDEDIDSNNNKLPRDPSLLVEKNIVPSKIKFSNTYHVTLNGDKRVITASNLDDIIKNIKTKYSLSNSHQIRVNYWSDVYNEWMFLDTFPPEKTKLQVVLIEQK